MSRLIFDAQVFQTPAWHRGMGKYSLELIRAIVNESARTHVWDEFVVILSRQMPIADELKKELLSLDHLRVEMLDLVPNDILNPHISVETNRKVVDGFIGDGDNSDSFLILSLMQGEISPVFPSTDKLHKSVLFYDLIPFMFHTIYLKNPITRKEYLTKIGELIQSDSFLAISKTVANDLAIFLGVPPTMITSIDGGPIKHDTEEKTYDMPGPFILMPTGNDLRKNNRRAIEAFDIFNERFDNKYTLVITSFFKPEEITDLQRLSSKVIFTGNISGAELNFLYRAADLVLFPSEYEGLGLPVLEALEHQTPVACSDISVFREISRTAFTYFDPTRIQSIANAIEVGISRKVNIGEASAILARYNWEKTAKTARAILKQLPKRGPKNVVELLIVSPDITNQNRGIGKLMTQLHMCLQSRFSIKYYQGDYLGGNVEPEPRVNMFQYIASFERMNTVGPIFTHESTALSLYHVADTSSYARIMLGVLAKPGIIVLHSLDLRSLWKDMFNEGLISKERLDLEQLLDKKYAAQGLVSLLAASRGVVVFSKQEARVVKRIVAKLGCTVEIAAIPLPSNGLVYDEVAPEAIEKALVLDEVSALDDMHYEVAISCRTELVVGDNDINTDVLLAEVEMKKYHSKKNDDIDYAAFVNKLEVFVNNVHKEEKV